jgi:hypothetical protein
MNEPSLGAVMANCQLPESAEFCAEVWEELLPQPARNIMEANKDKANKLPMSVRNCTAGAS